jgi:hypothetical protein
MPWTGGDSTVRHEPYVCPQTALRLVDGGISGEETAWTAQARGTQVDHAECRIKLKTPQRLRSIALYEDNADPVADAKGVRERISTRFGVYVHDAHKNKWMPAGVAADNQQLVNIFSCPAGTFDEILYFWAGRNDSRLTDGVVRLAELEVYSADEFSGMLEGGGESLDNLLNDSKPPAGRK